MPISYSEGEYQPILGDFRRPRPSQLTYFPSDMTGTCPKGTTPPDCYGGPKWTPNDPVFFMHHAVRDPLWFYFRADVLSHRLIPQMIDKIWSDWQQKSPKNKYSFGGGTVGAFINFATFLQFPTGLPPYLNVSAFTRSGR